MNIFLIRHGSTKLDIEQKMQGRIDLSLSDQGIKEAHKLSKALENEKFVKIYSSPLKRCIETANILNNYHKKEIKIIPELIEHSKGDWDGMKKEEIKDQYSKIYESFLNGEDPRPPKGENFKDCKKRINPFIENLKKTFTENEKILIISHGGINRVFLGIILNLPIKEQYKLKQDNCCLNIIYLKDTQIKTKINLTNHLK